MFQLKFVNESNASTTTFPFRNLISPRQAFIIIESLLVGDELGFELDEETFESEEPQEFEFILDNGNLLVKFSQLEFFDDVLKEIEEDF